MRPRLDRRAREIKISGGAGRDRYVAPDRGNALPTEYLWGPPAAAMLLGYLLGSIPFGLILTRAFGAGDLREIGSGNIGATNVLRTGRKGLAAATLLLDARQGCGGGAARRAGCFPATKCLAAAAAFLGHLLSGLAEVSAAARAWRRCSASASRCTGRSGWSSPVVWLACSRCCASRRSRAWPRRSRRRSRPRWFGRFDLVLLLIALALLVLWKHRANIDRLMQGTEPRVGGARMADAARRAAAADPHADDRADHLSPVDRAFRLRGGRDRGAARSRRARRRARAQGDRRGVVEREIAAVEKLGARYLFLDDADYPPLLAELDNAPAGDDRARRSRADPAHRPSRWSARAMPRPRRAASRAGWRSSWGARAWWSSPGWRAGSTPPRMPDRSPPARSG